MYAFHFQDGTWRISMRTHTLEKFPPYNTLAYKLYNGVYITRQEANSAIERIRELRS
jgi:hypothetical protein